MPENKLEKELAEAKEQLVRQEAEEKARIGSSRESNWPKLALELQKELKELRAQLEEVTEGEMRKLILLLRLKKNWLNLRKELGSLHEN